MRTIEEIRSDIQTVNHNLLDLAGKDGDKVRDFDNAKREAFDAINTKVRALDTELEEAVAAKEAEARTKAEDDARRERVAELLSRNARPMTHGAPVEAGQVPAAVRAAMEAEECPDWLREFEEGVEGSSDVRSTDREDHRAFRDYVQRGIMSAGQQLRDQSVGTPGEGGHTVPVDTRFYNRVVLSMKAFQGIERAMMVFTTSHGRKIPVPTADDTAQMPTTNTAEGVSGGTAPNVTFGQVELGAIKVGSGGLKVSTELLEDSGVMVEALLGRLLGTRIGRRIGNQLLHGDGQSGNMQGAIAAATASTTGDLAVSTTGVITDPQTALARIVRSVDIAYRTMPTATICLSDDLLNSIRTAVHPSGSGFLYPSIAFVGPDAVRRADGMRVIIDPNFPKYATGNDVTHAIVGDISQFWLRRVRGMRVIRNPFSDDQTDQVRFTLWHRCDSRLVDSKAIAKVQCDIS